MSRDSLNNPNSVQPQGHHVTPSGDPFAGAMPPSSEIGAEYLFEAQQLNAELRECLNGVEAIRPDVEGFVSLSQFNFQDARTLQVADVYGRGEHPFLILRNKIAIKVQELSSQASELCQSPEGEEAFMTRLEKQFKTIKATVVTQERKGCAEKITGLCDQIEQVVDRLRALPERSSHSADALERLAGSLRDYAHYTLGQSSIALTRVEDGSESSSQEISVAAYFEKLVCLLKDEVSPCIDQAAA